MKKRLAGAVVPLVLFAFAAGRPAHAAAPKPKTVFTVDAQSKAAAWTAQDRREHRLEDGKESYRLSAKPSLLADNPEVIRLDLPGLPPLEAVRTRFADHGVNWKGWSGRLQRVGSTEPLDGIVHLGYHGKRITGLIHFEGARYRIVGGTGRPQLLVRQSDEFKSSTSCGFHLAQGGRPGRGTRETTEGGMKVGAMPRFKTATRLDLMVLYPKYYFTVWDVEADLIDYVEDSIDMANLVFYNSDVDAYYNLVHIGPILGIQPAAQHVQSALNLLNAHETEITDLRDAFGADFVSIFIPEDWDGGAIYCGVANMPAKDEITSADIYLAGTSPAYETSALGDRAYSALRQDCGLGDYTFAHELGHNFGMAHRSVQLVTTGTSLSADLVVPYARGYRFPPNAIQYATVMDCVTEPSPCYRVPHFSDPNITYMGYATGVAPGNPPVGQWNAEVARDYASTYAAFRSVSSNTPPVPSVSYTCNSGTRTCVLNASGSTDNGSIASYHWDYGDGTSETIRAAYSTHTYGGSPASQFWSHLVVTDNLGQRTSLPVFVQF